MIIYDPKITGSFQVNGSTVTSIGEVDTISGSVVALNAATSSYALSSSISGSFTSLSASLSTRLTDDEGSIDSLNAASSSYLLNTTDTLTGDLTVTGTITAQEFHTEYVSGSIIYTSGSTKFGDSYDDVHEFTGSVNVTNSTGGVTGSYTFSGGNFTISGDDADFNLNITSGSSLANLTEFRFQTDGGTMGRLYMHKGNKNMYLGPTYFPTSSLYLQDGTGTVMSITGSSVGIGTSSPSAPLHIEGGTDSEVLKIEADNSPYIRWVQNGTNVGFLQFSAGTAYLSNMSNGKFIFRTNNSDQMAITATGNVGIGNINPSSKLHITTGDSGASSAWTNADELILESSGNAGLAFQTPNTGAATIAFQDPESVQAGFIQYLHGDNLMRFATNGNNIRAVIDSSGNVGINETTPASSRFTDSNSRILDISGNAINRGGVITLRTSDNSKEAFLANDGGLLQIGMYTNNDVTFYTNNTEKMRIDSDGALLVGDSVSPSTVWDGVGVFGQNGTKKVIVGYLDATPNENIIGGHNSALDAWDDLTIAGANLKFRSSTSIVERMRIDSSGFITTNPSADIQGALIAKGVEYSIKTIGNQTGYTQGAIVLSSGTTNVPGARGQGTFLFNEGNDTTWYAGSLYNSADRFDICRASSTTSVATYAAQSTYSLFHLNNGGSAYNATGTWGTISSDQRLKENIVNATPKLDDVMSLQVRNFNYIGKEEKFIGFIAQELEQVFPSLVTTSDMREFDSDGNVVGGLEDTKGVKVGMDFAILVKAIQEQQAIIEDLKARIETLENA